MNEKDISTIIAHHLDAASLLRLTMACKDSQQSVNQSEIVYACVLRTFTGIRLVPKGKECRYYWSTLNMFFSNPRPGHLFQIMPYFELITLIGNSITYDPPNTSDDDESGQDTVPMRIKVSDLFSKIQSQFRTLAGRRNVIKCAGDWKKVVAVGEDAITYRHDAEKLLDTIVFKAKRCFICDDVERLGWIGVH